MSRLLQQRTHNGQAFPFPRPDEIVAENPPCLIWIKEEGLDVACVTLRRDGQSIWQGKTHQNFIVPDLLLPAGEYEWNIESAGRERGWLRFSIPEDAVPFLRPNGQSLFRDVPDARPRMLFFQENIPEITAAHAHALDTLRRNVMLALQRPLPQPPRFHVDPQALPYREYFGQHRDVCDRDLVACALAHLLLAELDPSLAGRAAHHAKALFLSLCSWDCEGPCTVDSPWGDEIGLSHARCFPAVFDMLYDLLDDQECHLAAQAVAAYASQCERRLDKLDFCQNPGDSHAGRLPAYLGEAAMSLKGTGIVQDEVLIRWLNKAADIYGGVFPYFGGADGGWAEGMFYASSYTKWYLPFFCAVARFSGVDYLQRPFYRRFTRYLQHFCPPGWEIHPFGDGYWCTSDDPEWPGFFAQNPWHIYAERFGGPLLQTWSEAAQVQSLFNLHLLDVFLPEGARDFCAADAPRACAFPDSGFISLHTDPSRPENELALLARCSPYGSISHQHADQGSFALMAGGTALISPSGYFGRSFGTAHHRGWTRCAKAHNTILVDGQGQIGEECHNNSSEDLRYTAMGRILFAKDDGDTLCGAIDPSAAYEHVIAWTRYFELSTDGLTVTDHIELDVPRTITWCLHSLSRPEITSTGMQLERNGWHLDIVQLSGSLHKGEIADSFDVDLNEGEPEAYHVSMPPQYHMRWQTAPKHIHDICLRFVVRRDAPEESALPVRNQEELV